MSAPCYYCDTEGEDGPDFCFCEADCGASLCEGDEEEGEVIA